MTTDRSKTGQAALAGAFAGGIAGWLLHNPGASADQLVFPQSLLDDIAAARALQESIDNRLAQLLGGGATALENPSEIMAFRVVITNIIIAAEIPEFLIPYDHPLLIKALITNGGTIFIGNTQGDAQNINSSFPLDPGETVSYKIRNTKRLWIRGDTLNDIAVFTAEQRR